MSKRRESPPPDPQSTSPGQAELAHAVEMAEIVAHEINNLLNNILLNVAVLDRKVPEPIRAELAAIRQAGAHAGSLLNRWQQIVPRTLAPLQGLDLNATVEAAVKNWQATVPTIGITVQFEPAGNLPPVLGSAPDVSRLVRLLLANAAVASPQVVIMVRTESAASGARIIVEDNGPSLAHEMLDRAFEPFVVARANPASSELNSPTDLGLAVCKRLARRQQGNIHAENRAEGGVRIVVQLRSA